LLRVVCSLQRLQSPRSSRTIGKVSPAILLVAIVVATAAEYVSRARER